MREDSARPRGTQAKLAELELKKQKVQSLTLRKKLSEILQLPTPDRKVNKIKFRTPDHKVTFRSNFPQAPSDSSFPTMSKPSQKAFRTMKDLGKPMPKIDDNLLKDQTNFSATLMTLTTKERQLFCAIYLFASAVLTKFTSKASTPLSQSSGQDLSSSWDKIKVT